MDEIIKDEKFKMVYLLLKEQLDFYLIYIRKVDVGIFDKFEYCNKYYIKNLENGNKILFTNNQNMYIDKNVNLLADYKDINTKYHSILRGNLTIIYEIKDNYSIRYDYYTHFDKRATFCEIDGNLRICNFNNKTIYTFDNDFMDNLVKILHRDLDKDFVYEIIDFYEKSILKNDEEYTQAGFNQLKKKENEMNKMLEVILEKRENPHDTGAWGMEGHILKTKRPARYEEILTKEINFNLEFESPPIYKDKDSETFYKNLTDNYQNIVTIKKTESKSDLLDRFYKKTNLSIEELLQKKAISEN